MPKYLMHMIMIMIGWLYGIHMVSLVFSLVGVGVVGRPSTPTTTSGTTLKSVKTPPETPKLFFDPKQGNEKCLRPETS